MKRYLIRFVMVLAVAGIAQVALESQADAGLFGRRCGGHGWHRRGCCQQVCCDPAPVVECCVTDCCNRCGRRGRWHRRGCCCNGAVEVAPANGMEVPEAPDMADGDGGEALPL